MVPKLPVNPSEGLPLRLVPCSFPPPPKKIINKCGGEGAVPGLTGQERSLSQPGPIPAPRAARSCQGSARLT